MEQSPSSELEQFLPYEPLGVTRLRTLPRPATSNLQTVNQTETIQKYLPPTLPSAKFPPGQSRPKTAAIEPGLAMRGPVLQFFSSCGGKRMFNRSIAQKAMVAVTAFLTVLGTSIMAAQAQRSEEHTSELQSLTNL